MKNEIFQRHMQITEVSISLSKLNSDQTIYICHLFKSIKAERNSNDYRKIMQIFENCYSTLIGDYVNFNDTDICSCECHILSFGLGLRKTSSHYDGAVPQT